MQSPTKRPDGFPGQHHVVLPQETLAQAEQDPLIASLHPTATGYYPNASGHFVERSQGSETHILIVCTEGSGWVDIMEQHHEIRAGQILLIPADTPHAYGSSPEQPWTILWVHFKGLMSREWISRLIDEKTTSPVFAFPSTTVLEVNLTRIHRILEQGFGKTDLITASSHLRVALSELLHGKQIQGISGSTRTNVSETSDWMRQNLTETISLNKMASQAHLSPSHFSMIFKKMHGAAPLDWLNHQRIKKACHLLDHTHLKIAEVGVQVGLNDPFYFSRLFRRVMGCSPKAYRTIKKG